MSTTLANTCPRCGATFACGMQTGQEPCWCAQLPPLHIQEDAASGNGCYCPACLKQLVEAQAERSDAP